MELDITDFIRNECALDFSASVAEIGENAGTATWNAAKETAPDYLAQWLPDDDAKEQTRAWLREFGAWSEDEIASWSDQELCALLIQFISGDIREFENVAGSDWEEFERLSHEGTVSSAIGRGDDGRVYYRVGF